MFPARITMCRSEDGNDSHTSPTFATWSLSSVACASAAALLSKCARVRLPSRHEDTTQRRHTFRDLHRVRRLGVVHYARHHTLRPHPPIKPNRRRIHRRRK